MSVTKTILEFLSPLIGDFQITTEYGAPAAKGGGTHYALDFAAPKGTPVYAPTDSKVKRADNKDAGGGNIVELAAPDGITLLFAHLDSYVVGVDEFVKAGEIIGYVGSTGEYTTGNHLHLEARKDGKLINPLDLFDPLTDAATDAYATTARRVPLQEDGNCPVGFHRVNDGFFSIGGDMGVAYCEADTLPGAALAGALDWGVQLATVLGGLLDPANWLAWASLMGGAMLALFGLFMIWQTT